MTDFPQKEDEEAPAPPTEEAIPEPMEKEEGTGLLNAKWRNATFRLQDVCDWVESFAPVMEALFTPKGVDIEGMDPNHVARVHVHLDQKDFDIYDLRSPTPIPLPLNFGDFSKWIKRFNRQEDVISLRLIKESPLLNLECRQIYFSLKPASEELEPLKTLQISFDNAGSTKLDTMIEFLEFAHDHTDYIDLEVETTGFRMQGNSDDGGPFHRAFKTKDLRVTKPARSTYNIEYLVDILKVTKNKPLDRLIVCLEFTGGMPLHLTIRFAVHSYFQAYLAPRVEAEEEEEEESIAEGLKETGTEFSTDEEAEATDTVEGESKLEVREV